ncbi:MAG: DNA-processing protein DprA [Armatimonadota bacterium]|nr:DNA-processing protein DprA [Armatimonadota bacterium]
MEGPLNIEAWLRLNSLEFAPHRIHALLEAYGGDPAALFAAPRDEWRQCLPSLNDKRLAHLAAIRGCDLSAALSALEKSGAQLVTIQDSLYPANLRQLPDAPPVLFSRGHLIPEDKFSLAIVGSRRATSYGLALARQFARELTAHGLTVVSGGARGVDTEAHRGAVEAGGRSLAFLGCGVDIHYPSENRRLFDEIAGGSGAVLSEFPMGTRPDPWRFPARNRLISGSSLGVLVIESPTDSGSLITAREAGEQGREVFAIPGPIGLGHNSGCHKLIQDGAKLVESVEDILSELGVLTMQGDKSKPATVPGPPLPPEQRKVLDMLTLQPRQVEGMITESGLTPPQVMGILTLLEMRGLAKRVPGNAFVRVL